MNDISIPNWLVGDSFEFNIHQILDNSCFYPYGNFQGSPVKQLIKKSYSFVYIEPEATQNMLQWQIYENGFKGYEVIFQQDISQSMLTPNGVVNYSYPLMNEDYVRPNPAPFCKWIIFENKIEQIRFSFLFLTADAVASYQALYFSNKVSPRFVVFVYPRGDDRRLQNHWRNLAEKGSFFERILLSNKDYAPEYISFDDEPWESYSTFVEKIYVNYNVYKRNI
jgi:hypothetical protein